MAEKTTGLTAEEAKAALPGQDINLVCKVYNAPTGAVRVLYDLPTGAETRRDMTMPREAPAEPTTDNAVAEGSETESG